MASKADVAQYEDEFKNEMWDDAQREDDESEDVDLPASDEKGNSRV